MNKWNNTLNKTRTEKTHVKGQRWHKREVTGDCHLCIRDSENGHTPLVSRAPWRPGSQTTLSDSFPPLLSLPLIFPLFHFYLFLLFPSFPSFFFFSFGLDRLSRFVVLTMTVVFPSTHDICFHVLSLCICQFSLAFLPVRLYYLRSPYAPRPSSHLVKNSPQSFACIFSREGVWLTGCGLVPTGQISAQQWVLSSLQWALLISSLSAQSRLTLGLAELRCLPRAVSDCGDLRRNKNCVPPSHRFLPVYSLS